MSDEDVLRDFAAIVEGQCPIGHGPLDRRDTYGWCYPCAHGWSAEGSHVTPTVTMHFYDTERPS